MIDKRWAEWTDKFLGSKSEPLTKDMSMALISLIMDNDAEIEELAAGSFLYEVSKAHAARIGLRTTPAVLAFLGCLPNPAYCVMYVHAIRRFQLLRPQLVVISITDFATEIFPFGLLPDATLNELWDEQKCREGVGSDNYLDEVKIQL